MPKAKEIEDKTLSFAFLLPIPLYPYTPMHLRCVAEGEGVIAEGEGVIAEGEGVRQSYAPYT